MGICKSIYWRDIAMRRKLRGIVIAAFGLVVAATPGFAHHGFNVEFDKDRCSDLTGLLSALYWENPHAYFDVDVTEASGTKVTWHMEMITNKDLTRIGTSGEDYRTGRVTDV